MDEQLDNDLKNHIREVFDNFEDPAAREGWLLLREKYPEESNRRPLLWVWWSAAAIILLFLGIGLWFVNDLVKQDKFVIKTPVQKHSESRIATREIDSAINKVVNISGKTIVDNTTNRVGVANNEAIILKNDAKPPENYKLNPGNLAENSVSNKNTDKNNFSANTEDSDKTTILNPPVKQLTTNVQSNPEDSKPQIIKPEPTPAKKINSIFTKVETKPEKKENSKRVSFGVYAATYFNYAKGSNNAINAGAGVLAEIPLSKNLRLVSGIAIAQNSLNFNGNNIAAVLQNSTSPQSLLSITAAPSAAVVIRDYNASLVGLDVPVNLKYIFNPQRNDFYISAGLSSGMFINETYTYQYTVGTASVPTQNKTSNKGLNNFYLAKTLNVSFGMGFPFGKNRLTVEPFLKYPLDGLGSQNISFGAGGLNLKFNFQSSKK